MRSAPRRLRAALVTAAPAAALAAAVVVPAAPSGAVAPAAIPVSCTALDLDDATAVAANAEGTHDVSHAVVRLVAVVRSTAGSTGPATDAATATTTPGVPAARTLRVTVRVLNVLTGDLTDGRNVNVLVTGTDGKLPPRRNEQYLFFTTGANDALHAVDCNGYVATPNLDTVTLDLLRDALAPEDDADVVLTAPSGGSDGPPSLGRVVAPGAAITLVGLLGLVLLGWTGRRPTH